MADELLELLQSYRVSQAIHVVASLGVPDLLADGPRTSDDLAAATGSHPDALHRVLRVAAAYDILATDDDGRFALAPLGERLQSDVERSLRAVAILIGRRHVWDAWGQLGESVRTGETAFRIVHGKSVWEYRQEHPDESVVFDAAMAAHTRAATRALVDGYDFGRFRTIVDVAGGRGALLAGIVERYPDVQGILFDQPHVVADVDLGPRVRTVAGSFFDAVPAGGDAYLLKWILHDWEDPECVAILRRVREAIADGGRLLVVERELGSRESMLSDLQMLVAAGGRERTRAEYATLFAAAGFALVSVTPTEAGLSVFEGVPAA